MLKLLINKRGQNIAVEYVITFFLVLGVTSAMAVYIRRGVQGRMRDARNFMLSQVNEVYNGNLYVEYDPYYIETNTIRALDSTVTRRIEGPTLPSSGIFQIDYQQSIKAGTDRHQASPEFANQRN